MTAAFSTQADDISHATSIQNQTNQASLKTQQNIDSKDAKIRELLSEIEQLNTEISNLKIYKDHLSKLTANQNEELASLNQQTDSIKETKQGLIPLMYQMIDGLTHLIEDDKPILRERRLARVESLKALMGQADVADAEKYRQILETYQIELAYGSKMATYETTIHPTSSQSIAVEALYIGKVVFIARSLDSEHFWTWDVKQQRWLDGDDALIEQVNAAYQLANKKITPQLLTLPVSMHGEGE